MRDVPQRTTNIADNRALIDYQRLEVGGGSDAICGKRGDTI